MTKQQPIRVSAMTTEISISAFMGPETSPIQRALEAGYFADEGLNVRCEPAPGSIHQMVGLIDGMYDMAMTAVDNVIAYDEGQGGATPENAADLVVLLGCATDPRPLIARPGISGFADLKGARIAVDAVNTGFSFLLRQWLEDQGLAMDKYELIPVGAVKARWNAVQSGDCAAGLLGKADAAVAVAEGYTRLQSDPDPWDNYQGGVFTADRAWARDNAEALQDFKRAMLTAVDWVLAPENAAELPDLLIRHLPHLNLTEADARKAASELQSPQSILKPGLPLNQDGFRVVMDLRQKYGTPPATLGGVDKYLDLI
jgi:ABC-type nitrate/sulfonate/bicarbonate transport system substrate-binding protein